ncbi:MAG: hypothetical protein R3264_10990 [Anaerolineae bacterium]|nr:hypothetical protein [Anaerolineae bacterium]
MLKQYLAQEISWEKAEAIVNETREYAARLRAKLIAAKAETKPNGVGLQELIWDYFPANVANAETIESTPSDPVMPLFITFDYLLNRYFHGHVVQDIVDDE